MATVALPQLTHDFADNFPELVQAWDADPPPEPSVCVVDTALADELGVPVDVGLLSGTRLPDGAQPVAMGYAGHQFGSYSPRLGDGRALLLGELPGPVDVHLKGSGRTPFARGGDGKASRSSMLREHLFAAAMHALGVPTARSLAVLSTGEDVVRQWGSEPGGLLVRVAMSHIRVGTFEYAARLGGPDLVRRLVDHTVDRHYPAAGEAADPALSLLRAVVAGQAELVASWMHVGFIHGVMNTDNTAVSGETIDYGPCAFMDVHDPATVYSSIDRTGRYAYGNQPAIMAWNLTRLAETLVPLIEGGVELATDALRTFRTQYEEALRQGMATKLALVAAPGTLVEELLEAMASAQLDHTGTFRALAASLRGGPIPDGLVDWHAAWLRQLRASGRPVEEAAQDMDTVNPVYVPRNHLVEEALAASRVGDLEPFTTLLDFVTTPFVDRGANSARYAEPAPEAFDASHQTFCGT